MLLGNAVLDIQLNHREGHGTEGEVKAIAPYHLSSSFRTNATIHRVESPAIEIR